MFFLSNNLILFKDKIPEKIKVYKVIFGAFFILFLFAGIFLLVPKSKKICFGSSCFKAKVADTDTKRAKGLMYVREMREDGGMFFVFEEPGKHSFWMKNTLIPLDIIWIDDIGKVVYIKENAKPCKTETCDSFAPDKEAKYVLEINGGQAKQKGLKQGDLLKF